MTIAELFREKKITHRSYHICRANNIENLNQLKKYLIINKDFLKLQNCGKKSNSELIQLSKSYENKASQQNLFNLTFPTLSNKQQKLINSLIEILTNNLTERNKNALIEFMGNELTIDIFVNKVYENRDFKITKIKNIGKSSIEEIENYFNMVKAFTLVIIENN